MNLKKIKDTVASENEESVREEQKRYERLWKEFLATNPKVEATTWDEADYEVEKLFEKFVEEKEP